MFNLVNSKQKFPSRKSLSVNTGYGNKVYNSATELIGYTPLVKLNRIPKEHGIQCDIYAKCEFFNPAGSIKDRIAHNMLKDAETVGAVKPDTNFVEPTSGNTGIGVAYVAALGGHKCTIITQKKNSDEKSNTMRLLGAEVIVIDNNDSEIDLSRKFKDNDPDHVVILDQFENDQNPRTHYDHTGKEIVEALGDIDMVVMGAGTGGTITGVSYRVKEKNPNCIVVAADPEGSTFFEHKTKHHPWLVEGIGGSFTPISCDASVVDHLEKVKDKDAFLMARDLSRKEGLLCGGSSGEAMVAAINAIKAYNLGVGKRVVVVLPDGIRNYMSKFVTDQWMEAHLFIDPPMHTMAWWNDKVTDLSLNKKYQIFDEQLTCEEALDSMHEDSLAIITKNETEFVGAITKDNFRHYATNPNKILDKSQDFNFKSPVSKHLIRDCYTLALSGEKGVPTIGLLSRILDITRFVILGYKKKKGDEDIFEAKSVATGDDVLDYIFKKSKQ